MVSNSGLAIFDVFDLRRVGTDNALNINIIKFYENIIFNEKTCLSIGPLDHLEIFFEYLDADLLYKLLKEQVINFSFEPIAYGITGIDKSKYILEPKIKYFKKPIKIEELAYRIANKYVSGKHVNILSDLIIQNTKSLPRQTIDLKTMTENVYNELNDPSLFDKYMLKNNIMAYHKFRGIRYHFERLNNGRFQLNAPLLSSDMTRNLFSFLGEFSLVVQRANVFVLATGYHDGSSLWGSRSSEDIIESKYFRLFKKIYQESEFVKHIVKLENMPSIDQLVYNSEINNGNILDIRKRAEGFRELLHNSSTEAELRQSYLDAIHVKKDVIEKIPGKLIRFLIVNTLGVLNPPLGIVASAIDSIIGSKPTKTIRLPDILNYQRTEEK